MKKPVVMCFSGLDPTGGAGIQADIETLFSLGCHCAPIVTTLTVQTTRDALKFNSVEPALLIQQARAVLDDMEVKCFKLGLLGSVDIIEAVHGLLADYPELPVVLDPVFSAGGGFAFADDSGKRVIKAMRSLLLPRCTVLTPNTDEARQLASIGDADTRVICEDACHELLGTGCQHILLTGTHADTEDVVNYLYSNSQQRSSQQSATSFTWPRLPQQYHGSGCTLAAAVAAHLAHGLDVGEAVKRAQRFTWESLHHGLQVGAGQHLPNRHLPPQTGQG
ncbi:MAG: bifunctional hydroxymethylpyrimidine kinase/phosphomethylpyrimidine kinase [Pseudohongiellaceae bacterium]